MTRPDVPDFQYNYPSRRALIGYPCHPTHTTQAHA